MSTPAKMMDYCLTNMRPVADVYQNRFLENWQEITTIRKPIIAAVSGFAVNHSSLSLPCPPAH